MNLTAWAWLILPLGMTRLLQIALHDRIFEKPRAWLLKRLNPRGLAMTDPERPYLSFLLECPWCISVWLGFAVVALAAWDSARQILLAVLLALALSLLAVALDRLMDRTLPDPPAEPEIPSAPPAVQAAFAALGDEHDGAT